MSPLSQAKLTQNVVEKTSLQGNPWNCSFSSDLIRKQLLKALDGNWG